MIMSDWLKDASRVHLEHLEHLKYEDNLKYDDDLKQAGPELGQAQLKLGLDFSFLSVDLVSLKLVW